MRPSFPARRDTPPADGELLAEGAAKVWTGLYGPPREGGVPRRRGARRHCPGGDDGTLKVGNLGEII